MPCDQRPGTVVEHSRCKVTSARATQARRLQLLLRADSERSKVGALRDDHKGTKGLTYEVMMKHVTIARSQYGAGRPIQCPEVLKGTVEEETSSEQSGENHIVDQSQDAKLVAVMLILPCFSDEPIIQLDLQSREG